MFDPIRSPALYPGIPMARFGLIPPEYGGGSKYRVIWSPSRMVVLTGDGVTKTVPMYANGVISDDNPTGALGLHPMEPAWILEKWQSPSEYAGYSITAERWNADPQKLLLGPFPARGDYYISSVLNCKPSDANIEKLIMWVEEGPKRNPNDNRDACVNNLEKSLKDKKSTREAIIRDAMRPWNGADPYVSGVGRGRGSKTLQQLKSANELGLTKAGPQAFKRKRVFYEVSVEA